MNRLDFLKRLGIGAGAAVAAPVLAQEKAKEYHNVPKPFWQNAETQEISSEPTFTSIENKHNSYEFTEGNGLEVNKNNIKLDAYVKHGSYDYALKLDGADLATGKLSI